jgi:hypothetical protein
VNRPRLPDGWATRVEQCTRRARVSRQWQVWSKSGRSSCRWWCYAAWASWRRNDGTWGLGAHARAQFGKFSKARKRGSLMLISPDGEVLEVWTASAVGSVARSGERLSAETGRKRRDKPETARMPPPSAPADPRARGNAGNPSPDSVEVRAGAKPATSPHGAVLPAPGERPRAMAGRRGSGRQPVEPTCAASRTNARALNDESKTSRDGGERPAQPGGAP